MNNFFFQWGLQLSKKLFLKIILQGGGITKERMTKRNVYYNLTIKYCLDHSLVSIYNIVLLNKNNRLL